MLTFSTRVAGAGNPERLGSVLCAVKRVAMISLHTSPLLQPGSGDSGGMNVYVREVASALAQAGIECTTYTRADRPGLPREVAVEPGHRVVHVPAGRYDLPEGGAGARARRVHRRRARRHPVRAGRRRGARELLAQRRRRPPPQARARRPAGVDVPHPGPGQGRGRRPRAGVARSGRGRGHRLQRRHLRQLPGGGAAVPAAVRRSGWAHRDRPAGGRARLLRPGRSGRRAPGRRAAGRSAGSCCSSVASSR